MAVPKFQEFMLPTIKLMSDKKEREYRHIIEEVADFMNISEQDREEMLPSGVQARYADRVGWAIQYLKQAGLLETIKRGVYKITDTGIDVSKMNINIIDRTFLNQFESFRDFQNRSSDKSENKSETDDSDDSTPKDQIMSLSQEIKNILTNDLLDTLKHIHPSRFEAIVVQLLERMGYGAFRDGAGIVVGGPNDQGIDGVIDQDPLGLDKVYIQAKRWKDTVPSNVIQGFVGALVKHSSEKGVIITTGRFTKNAIEFAESVGKNISLIDGRRLAELMIEHNLGVVIEETIKIKSIDENFFKDI